MGTILLRFVAGAGGWQAALSPGAWRNGLAGDASCSASSQPVEQSHCVETRTSRLLANRFHPTQMKIRVLLFTLLSSVVLASAVRAAETERPKAPMHEHEKHTELGEHMEKMGRAFRSLGRQINDASKNEDSLKLVETIRTNAQAGLDLKPEKTADVAPEQRDEFVANFQQSMKAFLADVDKLEAALKAGNNQEAAALLKTLKKDQDEGHKEFRKKKDRM
jgi:soluble cytochrome b562